MNKNLLLLIVIPILASGVVVLPVHAQMMNDSAPSVNPTQLQQQQQDEAQGQKLFNELQHKETTCKKLNNSDFEKIGEYTMSKMFSGNTSEHIAMNQRIQQMRGNTGEEQMHTQVGENITGCNSSLTDNTGGGASSMMGSGGYGMMSGAHGLGVFGIFALIGWLVVLIDLILAGIWLWKQIKKK